MFPTTWIAGGSAIAGAILGAWLGYQAGHIMGERDGYVRGRADEKAQIAGDIQRTYEEKRDAARPAINNARDCILAGRVWDQPTGACRDGE